MKYSNELLTRYVATLKLIIYNHVQQLILSPTMDEILVNVLRNEIRYFVRIWCFLQQHTNIELLDSFVGIDRNVVSSSNFWKYYKNHTTALGVPDLTPDEHEELKISSYWDVIHLFSFMADDMVANRTHNNWKELNHQLKNLQVAIANLYVKLGCPMCVDHFLNLRGLLLAAFEHVRTSICLEQLGEIVEDVNLIDYIGDVNKDYKKIPKHYILYSSFLLHNHVNAYRVVQQYNHLLTPIQRRKVKDLYNPMDWKMYINNINK